MVGLDANIGVAGSIRRRCNAGVLFEERTTEGLAEAVRRLFCACPDRGATRRHAEQFSWDATTRGQIEIFRAATGRMPGLLQTQASRA